MVVVAAAALQRLLALARPVELGRNFQRLQRSELAVAAVAVAVRVRRHLLAPVALVQRAVCTAAAAAAAALA